MKLTYHGANKYVDEEYQQCWGTLQRNFKAPSKCPDLNPISEFLESPDVVMKMEE